MKILISIAVWGESYCSIFTRFSLASLLSQGNIPALRHRCSITYQIYTTEHDQRRMLNDAAVMELQRYCDVEWRLIEDTGLGVPPTGPSGEKYPYLSAIQNLAIQRSLDHDAIIFNYADFIWSDGSITAAIELLGSAPDSHDAVLAFCLPIDRDSILPALDRYRVPGDTQAIQLTARAGAQLAIEHMHREAKLRFWDSPGFNVTPSYIIWPVEGQGLVIRAYHQTILAMRVRPNDPEYVRGITRGSLDANLTANLAKTGAVAHATDTDKVFVFSLYDTPVDSRLPPGETRERSLEKFLRGDIVPEQRRFADWPILLKVRNGDPAPWKEVIDKSWSMLSQAHSTIAFDEAMYGKNMDTHGRIPNAHLTSTTPNQRLTLFQWNLPAFPFGNLVQIVGYWSKLQRDRPRYEARSLRKLLAGLPRYLYQRVRYADGRVGQALLVARSLQLLYSVIDRKLERYPGSRVTRSILFGVLYPVFFGISVRQALTQMFSWQRTYNVAPHIWVDPEARAKYLDAASNEKLVGLAIDGEEFVSALRKAELLLRHSIQIAPIWIEPSRALGRNLWFQGRFVEAIQTFAAAEHLRDVMAWLSRLPVDAAVFLPRNCAESIGLMGHIDAFVKQKLMTGDNRQYYLLAPQQQIVNSAFLQYWDKYVTIVSKDDELSRLASMEAVYSVNWNWVLSDGGKTVFVHKGIAAIQRAWQTSGRPPLLRLHKDHENALRAVCVKWGMKENDRYVCLHVRSVGFYGESREHAQRFRNTAIESYYPLMRALAAMGIWVIRMGDPSMPALDPTLCTDLGHVIDYAHSFDRSEALDVALCARCELFVSSPSGLHTVAHAFGRPVCEVNYPIYAGFPWHLDDIFIPQLYYSHAKQRILTLHEILSTDVVHLDHHFLLERAGISLLPNSPDEITETVLEALSPSSYRLDDAIVADHVNAAFEDLSRQFDLGISGRLGRYFAAKYASRLLPS